jgi:hypothetical protein
LLNKTTVVQSVRVHPEHDGDFSPPTDETNPTDAVVSTLVNHTTSASNATKIIRSLRENESKQGRQKLRNSSNPVVSQLIDSMVGELSHGIPQISTSGKPLLTSKVIEDLKSMTSTTTTTTKTVFSMNSKQIILENLLTWLDQSRQSQKELKQQAENAREHEYVSYIQLNRPAHLYPDRPLPREKPRKIQGWEQREEFKKLKLLSQSSAKSDVETFFNSIVDEMKQESTM